MSPALVIRLVVLMTLMPEADYTEVIAALVGDLAGVPWARPYRVPTATVVATWRAAVGRSPLEQLREAVLAGVDGEHHEHDWRAVQIGDLNVCAIDGVGSLVRTSDTPANRAAFGSAGGAEQGAPYPQLRQLLLSDASTRAALAVVAGAGAARDKGEAEQVLLDKALTEAAHVFTTNRLWIMDRNFPACPASPGCWPPAATCWVEYWVDIHAQDTRELFCLVTDLHDHTTYPADVLASAYHWRWVGSETALKEAKSTINGAGPSTGAILRSTTPELIAQEHAAWTTAVEATRATVRTAATLAAPA